MKWHVMWKFNSGAAGTMNTESPQELSDTLFDLLMRSDELESITIRPDAETKSFFEDLELIGNL